MKRKWRMEENWVNGIGEERWEGERMSKRVEEKRDERERMREIR